VTFGLSNSFLLGLQGFEIVFMLAYSFWKNICTSKNIVSIKWTLEGDDTLIMIYYIKEKKPIPKFEKKYKKVPSTNNRF
jgi:hypothetical protein